MPEHIKFQIINVSKIGVNAIVAVDVWVDGVRVNSSGGLHFLSVGDEFNLTLDEPPTLEQLLGYG